MSSTSLTWWLAAVRRWSTRTARGTAIRDFVSVADERPFNEQTVVDLFGPPPADAMLVFAGPDADAH